MDAAEQAQHGVELRQAELASVARQQVGIRLDAGARIEVRCEMDHVLIRLAQMVPEGLLREIGDPFPAQMGVRLSF
jgi:hypothetical protein